MPFLLRVTSLPSTAEIVRIPQIVIVDQTGPTIPLGTSPGLVMLVGEFLKGPPNVPTEVTSGAMQTNIFGGLSALLSQSGAATPVQDGSGVNFEGNGALQLLAKTFKRLGLTRVDNEAVTADAGGTTKSQLTIGLTIATADQTGGVTNKDILIPAGTRFGDQALVSVTQLVATSQDLLVPKGTTVTANAISGLKVNCFIVKEPEPVVAIAIAAIDTVIDSALNNVASGTVIATVNNAAAIWPPGTGTTLALRVASRYPLAITSTLPHDQTSQDTVVVWAARRTTAIRAALLANAIAASETGRGRMAVASCDPAATASATDALAGLTAAQGLAAAESLQSDRMILTFPQSQITSTDLNVTATINADGWMVSILSNFANERNPGANPAPLLNGIAALEQAYVSNPLAKQDYINLIAGGVSPLQRDRTVGWWFVDGVTAANQATQPTRKPVKRRRMADEIQDSLASIAVPYQKEPATTERVDAFIGEIFNYLDPLKGQRNPSAQRIVDYGVDPVSFNTPDQTALGIYTVAVYVRLLPTMDDIVFITQIGETVTVPATAQAPAA